MTTMQVELNERTIILLREVAQKLGVSPEELLKISVEEKLAQFDKNFIAAADYVFAKNTELYKRLA